MKVQVVKTDRAGNTFGFIVNSNGESVCGFVVSDKGKGAAKLEELLPMTNDEVTAAHKAFTDHFDRDKQTKH